MVTEMDYKVKNLYTAEDKYIHISDVFPYPLRLALLGQAGYGKTTCAIKIATELIHSDTLTIFSPSLEQEPFEKLVTAYTEAAIEAGNDPEDVIHTSNTIDRCVEEYDPSVQHLVIIDDLACKKNNEIIEKYFTTSRPRNISVILITQDYYNISPITKANCNAFISYRMLLSRVRTAIGTDFAPDIEQPLFKNILNYCYEQRVDDPEKELDFDAFFCITNINQRNLGLKYRRGFEPYTIFNKDGELRIYDKSFTHKINSIYKVKSLQDLMRETDEGMNEEEDYEPNIDDDFINSLLSNL
jgi:hypothetical protein